MEAIAAFMQNESAVIAVGTIALALGAMGLLVLGCGCGGRCVHARRLSLRARLCALGVVESARSQP